MRKLAIITCILLILGLWSSACLAAGEPATPELKLNDVINMALQNSRGLQKSGLSVEKAEESRNWASKDLNVILDTSGGAGGSFDAATEASFYGQVSADLTWALSKSSNSLEEDKLVLEACDKYWDVQVAISDLHSKEMSVKRKELTLQKVLAMIQVGMVPADYTGGPDLARTTAEKDLATARQSLEAAGNTLNAAYEALNMAIGLQPQDRPTLVETAPFEPLKVDDLEVAVSRALDSSPKIWQAEQSVTLAGVAMELGYASGTYKNYKVRAIEREQAEIDVMTARDATDLLVRNCYYKARNLEEGRPAVEKTLSAARESLRIAKLQYDLGMITKESLAQCEESLAQAQKGLLDNTVQHAYSVLVFQKPWAAASTS